MKPRFDFTRRKKEIENEIDKMIYDIKHGEFFNEESKNSTFELTKRLGDRSGFLYLSYFENDSEKASYEIFFKESDLDELVDLLVKFKNKPQKTL